MASHIYVLDSTLKRTQIKVTPGKFLREVLEEACAARKWSAENYSLKNAKDKPLDLSQPFRLSGLANGAKLQLVQASKSVGVVNVALDEAGGAGRLSDKFPSNTSVWMVLRKFEEGVAGAATATRRNFTERGLPSTGKGEGRLVYEQPCVQVMGRSLETFEGLQKTLAQLGFNDGSVSLRLRYQVTERPLEEAMAEISDFFKSKDDGVANGESSASQTAKGAHAATQATSTPDTTMPDAPDATIAGDDAGPEPTSPTPQPGPTAEPAENDVLASSSTTSPPPQQEQQQSNPAGPTLKIYRPPSNSTPAAASAPHDPTVFEPSIDQARALQSSLKTQGQNKRLLSDKELEEAEAERKARLASVQSVVVRFRYPDQCSIETTVFANETGKALYDKVRDTLARPKEPVELRFGRGEKVPDVENKRLVRDLGFRGKVLVTVVWGQGASEEARKGPSLKPELVQQAQEMKVELAKPEPEAAKTEAPKEKAAESGKGAGSGKGRGEMEAKLKKFMGFGKK